MRGGVPVFRRSTRKGSSRSRCARAMEGGSPARPPAAVSRPIWILPPRKVPLVNTTRGARKVRPIWVTAPATRPCSISKSSTGCWNIDRLGWDSSICRMAFLYSTRSAWARVARTAGPLRELSTRNWIPARSVARAIAPPRASTSFTRWLLPMPPIAGLQDIWPRVSTLWVSNRVRQPMRAAARQASVPAWPPPITMTSNCCWYSTGIGLARLRGVVTKGARLYVEQGSCSKFVRLLPSRCLGQSGMACVE